MQDKFFSAAPLVFAALLGQAGPAAASELGSNSNYTFGYGAPGFSLDGFLPAVQDGEVLLPAVQFGGVEVGFNPQPDPPGTPPTFLSLDDPSHPVFSNLSDGLGWDIVIAFTGVQYPPGPCRALTIGDVLPGSCAPPPNIDGGTGFEFTTEDGYVIDVSLALDGPGTVDPTSWVEFNPQPDPPGFFFDVALAFTGGVRELGLDPDLGISITLDGRPVDFSLVPEPASLSLFAAGLGALALRPRRRRRA